MNKMREVPGRSRDHDDFGEDGGPLDGGEAADHAGHRVADEDAGGDLKLLQDEQEVVRVSVQGGVSVEVEAVGVGGAGAHGVEQDDAVAVEQVGKHMFPHRLVRAEPMTQHHQLLPRAHYAHIVSRQERRCLLRHSTLRRPGPELVIECVDVIMKHTHIYLSQQYPDQITPHVSHYQQLCCWSIPN